MTTNIEKLSEVKWTPEQREAFEDRNHNLLVSASAGSGKTTVMIKRIVDLVLNDQIPISNFLVVTFTKASASDMKKKLVDELLKKQDDPFALSQIENVETSDISNLHSFCSRLISTYFYEVGVDPSYHIVDETQSSYLKDKALTKLFEVKEKQGDTNFFELFDIFQRKRNDKPLKDLIKRFNNFLNSHLDGKTWFETTLEAAHNTDLKNNVCAKLINDYVSNLASEDKQKAEMMAEECLKFEQTKLYDYFVELSSKLGAINKKNSFETNAKNVFEFVFDRKPTASKDKDGFEIIAEKAGFVNDEIKNDIKNFKENYVSDDEGVLIEGLNYAKKQLTELYNLTNQFNEIYSALKKEANGLDFNDLERYALKILSNQTILNAVKQKYKYVFVDEYQDINGVQEKIISLVSGKNNRFMVGDVKQSIYRFRLCDPDIFLQKYDEYGKDGKTSKLVKLNCNFRSDKKILKFVDEVFSGVMTAKFGGVDYEKDSKFTPGENNLDEPGSVNLCFIDTELQKQEKKLAQGVYSVKNHEQEDSEDVKSAVAEARYVVSKISELVSVDNPKRIGYGDIAVLVGSRNEMVKKFIETLKSFGIPVSSDEKQNLIDKTHIQELISFVKLLCNDKDDFVLFRVLKSRLFNFSDDELVVIRKLDMRKRFFDCVLLFENIEDDALKQKLSEALAMIEKFKKLAKLLSLKQLLSKIVEDFCLDKINLLNVDGENFNEETEKFIRAVPDVDAFDFVLNYSNFELEIENECAEGAVKVMTIHKSKGIEFKAVFVINTSNNFNMASTKGGLLFNKLLGVGMDFFDVVSRAEISTIPISAIRMIERRKLIEEQQRVLYVALTRAVQKMFIVCSKQKDRLNESFPNRPTCFANWIEPFIVQELSGKHNEILNFESYHISELLDVPKNQEKQLLLTEKEAKNPDWYVYKNAKATLIPLKNSVSKILKNKEIFDEEYESKIVYNESSSFAERGTAYHKVFQNIDLKNLQNLDEQIENLKQKFDENEWKLVDEKIIKNVLKQPLFEKIEQNDIILQEREFFAKMPAMLIDETAEDGNEFVLQGVVDLLVVKKDELWILDYKTGKLSDEKLEKYKFQIETYASVCERAYGKKVTKRYLCFVDTEKILEI